MQFRFFRDLEKGHKSLVSYTLDVFAGSGKQKFQLEFLTQSTKTRPGGGMDGYTYSFNGRTYTDVESLWGEPVEELSKNVQIVTDVYGQKVLKCYTQIPTFDSADREWDSKKLEFLMFDGKEIHLIVMRGGYRIASLTFYEKLQTADPRMKPIFEKLGWPVKRIRWNNT